MKKAPLIFGAAVVALAGLVWRINAPDDHESPHGDPSQDPLPASGNTSQPSSPAGPPAEDGTTVNALHSWLANRSAGISIQQSLDSVSREPTGQFSLEGATGDLGETPPNFLYQLRTSRRPILIGEKDNRHKFVRSVHTVNRNGTVLTLTPEVSISSPRMAKAGGFVFRRNEEDITELGVVIPQIAVPGGDDPASDKWAVSVRLERSGKTLSKEELEKLPVQTVDDSAMILMNPEANAGPLSARILWLRLDESGSFEIAGK